MKKLVIGLVVLLAALAAFAYFWNQKSEEKTYYNNVYNYEFKYDSDWEAITSRVDAGEVLFGPGATSDSGVGGVELMGSMASGQSLPVFVKTFNEGVQSGSTSETEVTINGQQAVVSILPGPGGREVKSVAFANGNQVFNVYIGYSADQKEEYIEKFDDITSTFRFTAVAQTTNNNEIIDDSKLAPGTKRYTSDALGITFTYNPRPAENFEVTVTEVGSKIYLHGTNEKPEQGKMIELFSKNANQSLSQAIKERFLAKYDAKNCFVVDISSDPNDPRPSTYAYAEISYPEPTDPNDPFWENASKCPAVYSKTNAVQYFMTNSSIPTKYVFLQLGQDSIADDGTTPLADGSRRDWSASIRIVK